METNTIIIIIIVAIIAVLVSVFLSGMLFAPDKTIDFTKRVSTLEVISRISPIIQENMKTLLTNIDSTKPDELKQNLTKNLEYALNSVKILDPKNITKKADTINAKLEQIKKIEDENPEVLRSLVSDTSSLVDSIPNTTSEVLQAQLDAVTQTGTGSVQEILKIKNSIIPEVKNTLQNAIDMLSADTTKKFDTITKNLQNQIDLFTSFQNQYKIDSDAFKVLVASSISDAKDVINASIKQLQDVNDRQDKDITAIQGVNQTQSADITAIQGLNQTQSADITAIQGVNQTQSADITAIQGVNQTQSADITAIQGVNQTQSDDITTILTVSIPNLQKLIDDLTSKHTTEVNEINTRLDSISKSLGERIDLVKTDLDTVKNDLNAYKTATDASISSLRDAVFKLSDFVSSDITILFNSFNNLKNRVETQNIIINAPQNKKWSIIGDNSGNLCFGNPKPISCIDANTGNLIPASDPNTELNTVVPVATLPPVSYYSITTFETLPDFTDKILNKKIYTPFSLDILNQLNNTFGKDNIFRVNNIDTTNIIQVNMLYTMYNILNRMVQALCPNKNIVNYFIKKDSLNFNPLMKTFVSSNVSTAVKKDLMIKLFIVVVLIRFSKTTSFNLTTKQITFNETDFPGSFPYVNGVYSATIDDDNFYNIISRYPETEVDDPILLSCSI